jgi:hypothetical protein
MCNEKRDEMDFFKSHDSNPPSPDTEAGGEPARISQGRSDWTSSRPTARKAGCSTVQYGCADTTRSSVPRDTTLRPRIPVITSGQQGKTHYGDGFTCKQQLLDLDLKKKKSPKQIIRNK